MNNRFLRYLRHQRRRRLPGSGRPAIIALAAALTLALPATCSAVSASGVGRWRARLRDDFETLNPSPKIHAGAGHAYRQAYALFRKSLKSDHLPASRRSRILTLLLQARRLSLHRKTLLFSVHAPVSDVADPAAIRLVRMICLPLDRAQRLQRRKHFRAAARLYQCVLALGRRLILHGAYLSEQLAGARMVRLVAHGRLIPPVWRNAPMLPRIGFSALLHDLPISSAEKKRRGVALADLARRCAAWPLPFIHKSLRLKAFIDQPHSALVVVRVVRAALHARRRATRIRAITDMGVLRALNGSNVQAAVLARALRGFAKSKDPLVAAAARQALQYPDLLRKFFHCHGGLWSLVGWQLRREIPNTAGQLLFFTSVRGREVQFAMGHYINIDNNGIFDAVPVSANAAVLLREQTWPILTIFSGHAILAHRPLRPRDPDSSDHSTPVLGGCVPAIAGTRGRRSMPPPLWKLVRWDVFNPMLNARKRGGAGKLYLQAYAAVDAARGKAPAGRHAINKITRDLLLRAATMRVARISLDFGRPPCVFDWADPTANRLATMALMLTRHAQKLRKLGAIAQARQCQMAALHFAVALAGHGQFTASVHMGERLVGDYICGRQPTMRKMLLTWASARPAAARALRVFAAAPERAGPPIPLTLVNITGFGKTWRNVRGVEWYVGPGQPLLSVKIKAILYLGVLSVRNPSRTQRRAIRLFLARTAKDKRPLLRSAAKRALAYPALARRFFKRHAGEWIFRLTSKPRPIETVHISVHSMRCVETYGLHAHPTQFYKQPGHVFVIPLDARHAAIAEDGSGMRVMVTGRQISAAPLFDPVWNNWSPRVTGRIIPAPSGGK